MTNENNELADLDSVILAVENMAEYNIVDDDKVDSSMEALEYYLDVALEEYNEYENKCKMVSELYESVIAHGVSRPAMESLHILFPDITSDERPLELYTLEPTKVCMSLAIEDFKEVMIKIIEYIIKNYSTIFKIIIAILIAIGLRVTWNRLKPKSFDPGKEYKPITPVEDIPKKYPNIPKDVNIIDESILVKKKSIIDTFYATINNELFVELIDPNTQYTIKNLMTALTEHIKLNTAIIGNNSDILAELNEIFNGPLEISELRNKFKNMFDVYFQNSIDLCPYSFDYFYDDYIKSKGITTMPIIRPGSDAGYKKNSGKITRHYSSGAVVELSGDKPKYDTCGQFWKYTYKGPTGEVRSKISSAFPPTYNALAHVEMKDKSKIVIYPTINCNIPGVQKKSEIPFLEMEKAIKSFKEYVNADEDQKRFTAFTNSLGALNGIDHGKFGKDYDKDGVKLFYPLNSNDVVHSERCSDTEMTQYGLMKAIVLPASSIFGVGMAMMVMVSKSSASIVKVLESYTILYNAWDKFYSDHEKLEKQTDAACDKYLKEHS